MLYVEGVVGEISYCARCRPKIEDTRHANYLPVSLVI